MDKQLKNEILGKALVSYHCRVIEGMVENIVTAEQFTQVAMSVLNNIDVDDIVVNYIITDNICER